MNSAIQIFMQDHPYLSWLFFVIQSIAFCDLFLKFVGRFFRMLMITTRGWPPDHLDADGDWKKETGDSK